MSVAVVSAIYGGIDQPKIQPSQTVDAEWILVTDREIDAPGWNVIVEPRPHMHPCLAAKIPKCLPHLYTSAETVVWIDGSCQLLTPHSIETLVTAAGDAPIAQVAHPARNCVYDEAEFCLPIPKYSELPITQQMDHYRAAGYPVHAGLWATGLIVWQKNADTWSFGKRWLLEQMRWGYQDQLCEAVVASDEGLKIHTLPWNLYTNGLFEWHAGHH